MRFYEQFNLKTFTGFENEVHEKHILYIWAIKY